MRFPQILSALLLASTLGACHSFEPATTPLPEFVVTDVRLVDVQEPSARNPFGMFGIIVGALAPLVGTAFVVACC